jgi:hypothetical protein
LLKQNFFYRLTGLYGFHHWVVAVDKVGHDDVRFTNDDL